MPAPLIAGIAGSIGSAAIQAKSAKSAASAQTAASNAQIAETRRQFDTVATLLRPYVNAGTKGLGAQMRLMGLQGTPARAPRVETITGPNGQQFSVNGQTFATQAEAQAFANANKTGGVSAQQNQQRAINGITRGAEFKSLTQQGEYGILANQAATGGLRGGDTQGALAQFRPALLQGLIDRQLQRYGGIAASGQAAAAMTGNAAQNAGRQVNESLGDQGAARAEASLASGEAWGNAGSGIIKTLSGLAQPLQPGGGASQSWRF